MDVNAAMLRTGVQPATIKGVPSVGVVIGNPHRTDASSFEQGIDRERFTGRHGEDTPFTINNSFRL